jgi:hypothetical protein
MHKRDMLLNADIRGLQPLKLGVVQTVINYAFKNNVQLFAEHF